MKNASKIAPEDISKKYQNMKLSAFFGGFGGHIYIDDLEVSE